MGKSGQAVAPGTQGAGLDGQAGAGSRKGAGKGYRPNPVSLRPAGHLLSPMSPQLARTCRNKVGYHGFI